MRTSSRSPSRLLATAATFVALAISAPASQFGPRRPASTCIVVVDVDAQGDVELIDREGRRSRPKTGTIELWSRYHVQWHRQVISVEDGRWSARFPSPIAWAVVGRVVLDGREAYVDRGGWDETPPPRCQWTAKLVAPVELTVVEADSGKAIADYEVREWDAATPPLMTRDGWVVTAKASGAFALPARSLDPDPEPLTGYAWVAKRSFWIRAPGRAWARVEADFAQGGDVVARLARSGALRVSMSPATRTRVDRVSSLALELDFAGTVVRTSVDANRDDVDCDLEGLAPGPLTVRWLLTDHAPPIVLAEKTVRVEAGPVAVVEL